ncbi:MAG: DUF3365 domain-containing protein [Pseudomonadota bacterium]
MHKITLMFAFCALALPPIVAVAEDDADALERKAQGRKISQQFAAQLKAALQTAMQNGGPVAAIDVCKDEAPRIASALSRSTGASVRRTSLKYRNPGNAPDEWEADALRAMAQAAGANAPAEAFTIDPVRGSRYLRAIPTQPVCLVCHGEVLADDVAAAIDEHYPHDIARGYSVGDIRGAFSIRWPIAPEDDTLDDSD